MSMFFRQVRFRYQENGIALGVIVSHVIMIRRKRKPARPNNVVANEVGDMFDREDTNRIGRGELLAVSEEVARFAG